MNVLFNGFDTQELTFKAQTAVAPGKAVALQSTGEINYPEQGEPFTGVVATCKNGIASVIMRGYAVACFGNTIPSVGVCKLSVGSAGNFELDEENGTAYTVVGVDLSAKTFEFIL